MNLSFKREFLIPKTGEILLVLRNKMSGTDVMKGCDITYVHVFKLLNMLEKANIVESYKDGRVRWFSLTESGVKLREAYKQIEIEIKGKDDNTK